MQSLISMALSNFTLTLLLLSIIVSCFSLFLKIKKLTRAQVIDVFFSYFLLFNIGVSYLYNFIMHTFFGDFTAHYIGWAQSPFQLEIGFASLGFAVIGIISFWSNIGFRAATVIAPAVFLWGAAGGHIYQMITENNYAPGNSGVIFWTDIFIPMLALILLWLQYTHPKKN